MWNVFPCVSKTEHVWDDGWMGSHTLITGELDKEPNRDRDASIDDRRGPIGNFH